MQSLLGKIVSITDSETEVGHLEISFRPACIMPRRTGVPEWLKDQTLKVKRVVSDPREIGNPGDSIILTPAESAKWLYPLVLSPDIAYGELPEKIRIELSWWKDEKAPDCTIHANGRRITAKLEKDGDGFAAEVETKDFYNYAPKLPVDFEVACDKLKACSSVLPAGEPFCKKLLQPQGEVYRIENDWFSVDITTKSRAAGILALREKGRGIDHFRAPENLIQAPLELAGHSDRLRKCFVWWGQMDDVAMTSSGARHEGGAANLVLEGMLDEGLGLRTTLSCTLYDTMPLIAWRRDYHMLPSQKKEDNKGKPEAPKEPSDNLSSLSLAFHGGWIADRNEHSGSRVLCADNGRLAVVRCAQTSEAISGRSRRMSSGWAVVEHPARREYMMYLFDERSLPYLLTWLKSHTITLEPSWPSCLIKPENSLGKTLGITAGERCGASGKGAWVASRIKTGSGIRCGAIARLDSHSDKTAVFTIGKEKREAELEKIVVTGIGTVYFASADFTDATMSDDFDAAVADIASRRQS